MGESVKEQIYQVIQVITSGFKNRSGDLLIITLGRIDSINDQMYTDFYNLISKYPETFRIFGIHIKEGSKYLFYNALPVYWTKLTEEEYYSEGGGV